MLTAKFSKLTFPFAIKEVSKSSREAFWGSVLSARVLLKELPDLGESPLNGGIYAPDK